MAHSLAVEGSPSAWVDGTSSEHAQSLADDPGFLAALDDLDRGVFGFITDARKMAQRPPLIAQLVVPGARAIGRLPQKRTASMPYSARRRGVSVWAASWIILAALSGASAAGLMFHTRLSQIIMQWEAPS